MTISTIANAKNKPLTTDAGTVPDPSGAMRDWFQPMQFQLITKSTVGFQVVETETPVDFEGVLQPFTDRQLFLRPEGERAWTWILVHADPVLTLQVDDIINYLGTNFRVMSRKDYTLYNYVQYSLVQDWTGETPKPKNVLSYGVLQYGMEMPGG